MTHQEILQQQQVYDSDGTYDNSTNYRFTPATAGKYVIFGAVTIDGAADQLSTNHAAIYKNGSKYAETMFSFNINSMTQKLQVIVDASASDYYELYGKGNATSGNITFQSLSTISTYFGGFKI